MKRMILIGSIFLIMALLAACTPKPEQIAPFVEQTLSAWPTQTAYPTYTPNPTCTPMNTATPIIKIVTPTLTASPIFTPTNTLPPTATLIPTATPDPLKASRGPGYYLIGIDIAPGVWRNDGTTDNCYWSVTTRTGDIIANDIGMGGGTAYIPASGFQIEFGEHCGNWTWLSN